MNITKQAFQEVENQNFDHLHDDFVRQNVLGCICSEGEVVATFLHSFSSIYTDATRSFRYMDENFPEIFFQKIKNLGIKNVMTSHYLAIHPEWRKGTNQLQIAPIMVGLTLRVRDLFEADAFIGVWRRDRKVHELAYAQGGECIISNISSHNTPCDLILMNKTTPYTYPSKEVEQHVNYLWDNRIEALFHTKSTPKRQTA
ncbi:MAG: hypothetical protein KA715_07590 [Xanthomonadaceae bacterium]|nr:hypothetical protein [Xanthomonadaceae bacterium]